MHKIYLVDEMKTEFIEYGIQRHINAKKTIPGLPDIYISAGALENGFDWFVSHKLRLYDYGRSCYNIGKRITVLSVRFVDYTITTVEEMKLQLFHEIYCEIEWIARAHYMDYIDTCISVYGRDLVKKITG